MSITAVTYQRLGIAAASRSITMVALLEQALVELDGVILPPPRARSSVSTLPKLSDADRKTEGRALRAWRYAANRTLAQVAALTGVALSILCRAENGRCALSAAALAKVAAAGFVSPVRVAAPAGAEPSGNPGGFRG